MGSFSWLFADTNNTKNLRADRRGYVACPDGTFICEPCYETYGIFDGKDIYDLVVDWNRKFIAENPDHLLPPRPLLDERWCFGKNDLSAEGFPMVSCRRRPVDSLRRPA